MTLKPIQGLYTIMLRNAFRDYFLKHLQSGSGETEFGGSITNVIIQTLC